MSKAEEACTGLLKIFGDIPELYERNREIIDRCDLETQDLQHEMELSPNQKASGGYRLYREMRDVRRERRRAKDENELLQPLVDALKQQETFRLRLYKVHERIKEMARQQGERRYYPRVRDGKTTDIIIVDELHQYKG